MTSEILQLLRQAERRLDAYEYSEENLEFLSNPHQIATEEELSQEEINSIWGEIAESLMLTPQWAIAARIEFTLSRGNRFHTFTQLLPRLTGMHKEKFKAIGVAYAPQSEFAKYADFAATI